MNTETKSVMEVLSRDPNGSLHAGSVLHQMYSGSRTNRTVHGVIVSPHHESDDIVLWTTETADGGEPRIHAGRRAAMNRWEPAPAPVFEDGRSYRNTADSTVWRVIHVFDADSPRHGELLATDENDSLIVLNQSDRGAFEAVHSV